MPTPGTENLCLYFAALQSLTQTEHVSVEDARALKQKVHLELKQKNAERPRASLLRAIHLTKPNTDALATDEVIPALATVLHRTVVVHEGQAKCEIDGWNNATKKLHIYYVPGHYYANVPAFNNFI